VVQVITASRLEWIAPFTGLTPGQFRKLVGWWPSAVAMRSLMGGRGGRGRCRWRTGAGPNVLLKNDDVAAIVDFGPPTPGYLAWEIVRLGCDPKSVLSNGVESLALPPDGGLGLAESMACLGGCRSCRRLILLSFVLGRLR
jgi:hypothetical protein